jgi:hypothetical protein
MGRLACKHLGNIPDFAWEAAAASAKLARGRGRQGGGAGRDVPPRSPSQHRRRFRAHFRRAQGISPCPIAAHSWLPSGLRAASLQCTWPIRSFGKMNWANPTLDITKSDFGRTNAQVIGYCGRQLQYSFRLLF